VRSFAFVEWPRAGNAVEKAKTHNNQSLLTLNMCIYELYKISCHQPDSISQAEVKQLWANFRTTHITMILKYFFMRGNRLTFIGCLSLAEKAEQDNFQVLMVGKNLSKIDLGRFTLYAETNGINHRFMDSSEGKMRKMRTEPV
jgi:hypothetical protein